MYLAIDIGGTKTLIAPFSNDGNILKSIRFETPKSYPDFLVAFKQSFEENQLADSYKLCAVGAPGIIDRVNGIGMIFGNLPWENVPLMKDINVITNTKTLLENDANLAGLSEAILVKDTYRKALYITVSTGIGGVLIVDGKIDPVLADTEIGHMKFEHEGKIQEWEDFASGRAIVEKFGMPASEITDSAMWYEISRNIALGLINVISTLNPDVVIIGGGVGSHYDKFKDHLLTEVNILASEVVTIPPIIPAQRAEQAVLYGCYELARQQA